ncbi:MAG TPA: IPT/TIG domain-containing protein [Bryobacteraceae bacterium]|nr:IPT/TIG domain-containing protein [Bryobacteraceae bacterium]
MTLRSGNILFAALLSAFGCNGQVVVQSVLNAASYSPNVAPGTYVAIFGTNLASATSSAPGVPLPTQLGGVTVTIGGLPAPINFISSGQINAVIPFEVAIPASGLVPVIVNTPAGSSAAFGIHLSRNAPSLFTKSATGAGAVLAFDGNFALVAQAFNTPLILYATGLGPTTPAGSATAGGSATPPYNLVTDSVSVFIGDAKATIGYAGLAPNLPGVYQLNVTPNGPISDRVYLQVGNWQSNLVSLPAAGAAAPNVANVTGSIDGLYPATGTNAQFFGGPTAGPISSSVMFMGASLTLDFDILATAKPFSVVGTSEAGTVVINIDPAKNTYQATSSVPQAAPRVGDFSSAPFLVRDFATCTAQQGCTLFPGNIIPVSRMDPVYAHAIATLPLPNTAERPDGINGIRVASGSLSGGHFSISSTSLPELAAFGGFIQIAHGAPAGRTTTFSLYVDGKLVAGRDVDYTVR